MWQWTHLFQTSPWIAYFYSSIFSVRFSGYMIRSGVQVLQSWFFLVVLLVCVCVFKKRLFVQEMYTFMSFCTFCRIQKTQTWVGIAVGTHIVYGLHGLGSRILVFYINLFARTCMICIYINIDYLENSLEF